MAKESVHLRLMCVCVCVFVVVGGLLSAHLLAQRAGMELEPGWPCSGPLLRMAEDAARKLLPGVFWRFRLSSFNELL